MTVNVINGKSFQQARLFILPLLKLLHIPKNRRRERIGAGNRGPIIADELRRAAARYSSVTMTYQAVAIMEQHAQVLALLRDEDGLFQHGELKQAKLELFAKEVGPSYMEALLLLGYKPDHELSELVDQLREYIIQLQDQIDDQIDDQKDQKPISPNSKREPTRADAGTDKVEEANPVATEGKSSDPFEL